MIAPLLDQAGIDELHRALTGFTPDAVDDVLGPIGSAALTRGDLAGARRAARGRADEAAILVRLFTLDSAVSVAEASRALGAALEPMLTAGMVRRTASSVRATLDIRPYAEVDGPSWWLVSDFGSDVRGDDRALPNDHVLGLGAAASTLAQATVRTPVGRALDIGTGSGVQALHLSRHAAEVVATDISTRALRMAATTAALSGVPSGVTWDLREGSFTEPVAGETFDLVVANPPFVVSSGDGGYDYRDSGLAGDDVCRLLLRDIPPLLAPGGTAQLLANWIVPVDDSWQERVGGWLEGSGCDAWVWQREVADLGEYVTLWLRDAGLRPGVGEWDVRYDAWLDWFEANGVAAVGMGLVTLWNTGRDTSDVVLEDVPQAIAQPVGPHIAAWRARRERLLTMRDDALLRAPLRAAAELVRTRADLLDVDNDGWSTRRSTLRQSTGLRWEVEVDDVVADLVAACDIGAPALVALELLAASSGLLTDDVAELTSRFAPILRDLVGRGVLEFRDVR